MTAREFKPVGVDDVVRIRRPRRDGCEVFFALVTIVESHERGEYFGYTPVNPPRGHYGLRRVDCGAWGYAWNERRPKPFSAEVDVVGHTTPVPGVDRWQLLPTQHEPGGTP